MVNRQRETEEGEGEEGGEKGGEKSRARNRKTNGWRGNKNG